MRVTMTGTRSEALDGYGRMLRDALMVALSVVLHESADPSCSGAPPYTETQAQAERVMSMPIVTVALAAAEPGVSREPRWDDLRSFLANVEMAAEDNGTPAVLIEDLWALFRDWQRDHPLRVGPAGTPDPANGDIEWSGGFYCGQHKRFCQVPRGPHRLAVTALSEPSR